MHGEFPGGVRSSWVSPRGVRPLPTDLGHRCLERVAVAALARVPVSEAWLFGSRARGDHRPGSDWDVLLVVPDPTPDELVERRDMWEVGRQLDLPLDIHLYRASEARDLAEVGMSIPREVARDGFLFWSDPLSVVPWTPPDPDGVEEWRARLMGGRLEMALDGLKTVRRCLSRACLDRHDPMWVALSACHIAELAMMSERGDRSGRWHGWDLRAMAGTLSPGHPLAEGIRRLAPVSSWRNWHRTGHGSVPPEFERALSEAEDLAARALALFGLVHPDGRWRVERTASLAGQE